jgi:hypothetical protein
MRTLLRATLDVQASNRAIIDGTLPKIMKDTADRLQPEATYYFTQDGCRSCFMVFDLKDPSDIPAIAEVFFLNLNAKVEFTPVMNADDLQKGLSKWQKSSKFIPRLEPAHHN